jgi:hypothetical protein
MFKNCPVDVINLVMNMLSLNDLLKFTSLSKEYNELKKNYNYSYFIHISGSINDFIKSFPSFKYIDICKRNGLRDYHFQLCNNIQKINMRSCDMSFTTDNIFSNFTNLKELNLLHCLKTDSNKTYSDKIFDYLLNLEKFSINYNHVITDQGLEKLVNLKDLYIVNCFHITGCGISNLTSLIKLDLFKIKNLFDYHFKNLINLEELKLSFTHNFTTEGITQLPKLKKLYLEDCRGITSCNNFNKLKNLDDLSFNNCYINDNDFIHLLYIKKLFLINSPLIQGYGFKYLVNLEELTLRFTDNIKSGCITLLPKLKKLNCFECRCITSCINYDKLANLNEVSFKNCRISDNDLAYLKYIKKLYIINCPLIQGDGFKYLVNIEVLSICEIPIIDHFIDDIIMLKNIKKLSICNRDYYMMGEPYVISNDRKNQLKQIFGDKFNENF